MKYRSWKLPVLRPSRFLSSLNFIIPCLDTSTLLAVCHTHTCSISSDAHVKHTLSLYLSLTQVDEHGFHREVFLQQQVAVCPQRMNDGQNSLLIVQWPLWHTNTRVSSTQYNLHTTTPLINSHLSPLSHGPQNSTSSPSLSRWSSVCPESQTSVLLPS